MLQPAAPVNRRRILTVAAALLLLLPPLLMAGRASAARGEAAGTGEGAPLVFTPARVRSFFEEADGKLYVRLKLLPRAKIPFTTQAFLVTDRALLSGISEGASVKFTTIIGRATDQHPTKLDIEAELVLLGERRKGTGGALITSDPASFTSAP